MWRVLFERHLQIKVNFFRTAARAFGFAEDFTGEVRIPH